jgi:hypothetical protein
VTFRYRESDTRRWQSCTLRAEEFIRRFLQHVLPKGFQKVRYYGLFRASQRPRLALARRLLGLPEPADTHQADLTAPQPRPRPPDPPLIRCPTCGQPMRHRQTLPALHCHSP